MPVFSKIQMSMKFHLMPVEILPIQSGQEHVPVPKLALVRHVVDREERSDVFIAGIAGIFGLQIRRDQTRLPIVGVEYVNVKIEKSYRFHRRPAQENEPLAVVDVIFSLGRIELIAIEILILLDQIDRYIAVGHLALQKMTGHHFAADRNDEINAHRLDRLAGIKSLTVGRHNDRHVVS